jgi:hypothetical protein
VVLRTVGDGQESYNQEAQMTEHCCWVVGGLVE